MMGVGGVTYVTVEKNGRIRQKEDLGGLGGGGGGGWGGGGGGGGGSIL